MNDTMEHVEYRLSGLLNYLRDIYDSPSKVEDTPEYQSHQFLYSEIVDSIIVPHIEVCWICSSILVTLYR